MPRASAVTPVRHPVADVRGHGCAGASRTAPRSHPGLVRDLAPDVRWPGRPDRGHAACAGRGEALDRTTPVLARPELLHAAPRPRSATARDLCRLVAQRDGG